MKGAERHCAPGPAVAGVRLGLAACRPERAARMCCWLRLARFDTKRRVWPHSSYPKTTSGSTDCLLIPILAPGIGRKMPVLPHLTVPASSGGKKDTPNAFLWLEVCPRIHGTCVQHRFAITEEPQLRAIMALMWKIMVTREETELEQ